MNLGGDTLSSYLLILVSSDSISKHNIFSNRRIIIRCTAAIFLLWWIYLLTLEVIDIIDIAHAGGKFFREDGECG